MNRQKKKLAERLACYRAADTLPPDLQAALQAYPDVKAEWEQTQRLVSLLSFKQYERPDPDVASRCRSSVLRQLRSVGVDESYPLFDWRWDGATPIFRLGLAAMFLAMIGLQLLSSPNQNSHMSQQAEIGALPFAPAAPVEARRIAVAPTRPQSIDFTSMGITNWPPRAQSVGLHSFVSFEP